MIEIEDLSYGYPRSSRPILESVSMKLEPGRVNVVLGMNGAGKTTLFDVLSGAISTQASITGLPPTKRIVYQLQSFGFPAILRGGDVIRLLTEVDHSFRGRVTPMEFVEGQSEHELELVDRLWGMRIGDMSVGERRWILVNSICRMDRDLYIFDEPTSGVDPSSRALILQRIASLTTDPNRVVIMSTHTLHELKFIACRIFFLHRGRLIFEGDYESLLARGKDENPDLAFQNLITEQGSDFYAVGKKSYIQK